MYLIKVLHHRKSKKSTKKQLVKSNKSITRIFFFNIFHKYINFHGKNSNFFREIAFLAIFESAKMNFGKKNREIELFSGPLCTSTV